MSQLQDGQAIAIALKKLGANNIWSGIQFLRSKGKGGLISAFVNQYMNLPIEDKNSAEQIVKSRQAKLLDAARRYTAELYDKDVDANAGTILTGWGFDYLIPVYKSVYGDLEPADDSIIAKFKIQARKWALDVKNLAESTPATDELKKRKVKLLKRAKYIKSSINTVLPNFTLNTGELGAVPALVPVITLASLGAFSLLMLGWIKQNDTWQKENKLSHERFLTNPQAAIQFEKEKAKGTLLGGASNVTKYIAIAAAIGGAIYFYNQYKKGK